MTWDAVLRHFERLFWGSVNSHTICNPVRDGQNLVLCLKASLSAPYDTATLRPAGITLGKLLSE